MEDKEIVFAAEIPVVAGRAVALEIKVTRVRKDAKLTIDLEPVDTYMVVSICGSGGQNIEDLLKAVPGEPAVVDFAAFWRRWHLNDMKPGTRKQAEYLATVEARTGKKPDAPVDGYPEKVAVLEAGYQTGELERENRPASMAEIERQAEMVMLARKAQEKAKLRLRRLGGSYDVEPTVEEIREYRKTVKPVGRFTTFKVLKWKLRLTEDAVLEAKQRLSDLREHGVAYSYGSGWLVELLPEEELERLKQLCDALEALESNENAPWIEVDGKRLVVSSDLEDLHEVYGGYYLETGTFEYMVFETSEAAGQGARDSWEDMAQNDSDEFGSMVGQETLVSWALGRAAGPGTTQVTSLKEWLDLWLDTPEEHWASYDGEEYKVTGCSPDIEEALGFRPGVAYRH